MMSFSSIVSHNLSGRQFVQTMPLEVLNPAMSSMKYSLKRFTSFYLSVVCSLRLPGTFFCHFYTLWNCSTSSQVWLQLIILDVKWVVKEAQKNHCYINALYSILIKFFKVRLINCFVKYHSMDTLFVVFFDLLIQTVAIELA